MLKIGLTGGIASGKSTVAEVFRSLGVPVIDADQIARDLFAPGSPHLITLKHQFGEEIFHQDQTLNRSRLRAIVFNDPEALKWLNDFTHPLVRNEMMRQIDDLARKNPAPEWVLLDIPLLINRDGEVPQYLAELTDKILVIDVDPEIQVQRLIARDNCSQEQAWQILNNQATREQRLAHADFVIVNDGSLEALRDAIVALNQQFRQSKQ